MNLLLDLFFPKRCVGCRKFGTYFCAECITNIKQTDLVCPKCEKLAVGGVTHPVCRRKFGLDGLWSLGIYQGSLRSGILKLKYKFIKELAEILVDITIEYWARYQPFIFDEIKKNRGQDWIIVPVPLHWYRKNWRGFNQSSLIAKLLAEKLGLDYREALVRIKHTKSQAQLKGFDRHQNIKNAFALSTDYTPNPTPYLSERKASFAYILLIDDVWTTGSTLRECCYILKRLGAKKVWALTLAR